MKNYKSFVFYVLAISAAAWFSSGCFYKKGTKTFCGTPGEFEMLQITKGNGVNIYDNIDNLDPSTYADVAGKAISVQHIAKELDHSTGVIDSGSDSKRNLGCADDVLLSWTEDGEKMALKIICTKANGASFQVSGGDESIEIIQPNEQGYTQIRQDGKVLALDIAYRKGNTVTGRLQGSMNADTSAVTVDYEKISCEGPEAKGYFDGSCSNGYKIHIDGSDKLTISDASGNNVDAMPCTPLSSPSISFSDVSIEVNKP